MKVYKFFLVLVIGIVIGVIFASLGSDLIQPYLPGFLKPKKETMEGKVVAKELQQDTLLITVSTPTGAMLVTFNKKVPEINLLVEKGNMITLSLHEYEAFVHDPTIKRVRKAEIPQEKNELIPRPEVGEPSAAPESTK